MTLQHLARQALMTYTLAVLLACGNAATPGGEPTASDSVPVVPPVVTSEDIASEQEFNREVRRQFGGGGAPAWYELFDHAETPGPVEIHLRITDGTRQDLARTACEDVRTRFDLEFVEVYGEGRLDLWLCTRTFSRAGTLQRDM